MAALGPQGPQGGRLQGRRILVTRPAPQAGALAEAIAAQGGEARIFPLIEILALDDPAPLDGWVAERAVYAWAVFVSPNAVDNSVPALLAAGPWPAGLRAVAVGPGTAARLAAFGVQALSPKARFDSEGVLELPELQAEHVAGRRVAIVRGNGGRELIAETLAARGARVDAVPCYLRRPPRDAELLVSWLHNNALDAVAVSSSEGLRNLFALLDTESCARLARLPVFVPHPRIAETAAGLGLRQVVSCSATDAGVLRALCEFDWPDHDAPR